MSSKIIMGMDAVQGALDVAGLAPGVGIVADLANAGISVARGNYADASLSMAAAIPIVGTAAAAGAGKIAHKVTKVLGSKGGRDLFRVVDDAELADIQKIGGFRTIPEAFEGKQFVDNLDDAKALQQTFSKFFDGNQTIAPAQAPQSVLDRSSIIPFADIPRGKAITISQRDLPLVKPRL